MKKSFLILSSIFLFFVGLATYQVNVLLNKYPETKNIPQETNIKNVLSEIQDKRNSITFILGQDTELDNPYYSQATYYYRNHPSEKDNWLNVECRSLKEVMRFLETHSGHQPWGKINLVVHSNEWRGMGLPIIENGERINTEVLTQALMQGAIKPLSNSIIDHQTEITISGCALGKNHQLLSKLAYAFGGDDDEVPSVKSSKYFITYASDNGHPKKYYTAYFHTNYKTGYRPGDIKLSNALRQEYPNENINFRDALSRKMPRFAGDSYHYTFNIPVNWIVTFSNISERPNLENEEAAYKFLNEQEELLAIVNKLNIPLNKFRWQFKKIDYTFEDGTKEPAILIKGKTSVLCVLKSMTKPNTLEPFIPDSNNETFFTTIVKTRSPLAVVDLKNVQ